MSATSRIVRMKEDLLKEFPAESEESVDRCRDILGRLDEVPMSVAILADTMIGKTVAQLKAHESLGSAAKKLIKKWKQIAKGEAPSPSKPAATAATTPAKPKAERRTSEASSSGAAAGAGEPDDFLVELQGLSPTRQIICKKFMDIFQNTKATLIELGINEAAIVHLLGPRAIEVEAAIWSSCPEKKAYMEKGRSLVFNLKRNQALTQDLILGNVTPETLAKMTSDELLSDEKRQERSEEAKKVIDSKRLDWDKANESKINQMCGIKGDLLKASLFTCGRCKSTKTTSTQKQTRSADEPMTVFVLCLNCGKRWKC